MHSTPQKNTDSTAPIEQLEFHHRTFFGIVQTTTSNLLEQWQSTSGRSISLDGNLNPAQASINRLIEHASIMDHPALYANISQLKQSLNKIKIGIAHADTKELDSGIALFISQLNTVITETSYCSQSLTDTKLESMLGRIQTLHSLSLRHELSLGVAIISKYTPELSNCYTDFSGFGYTIHEPQNSLELEQLYQSECPQILVTDTATINNLNLKKVISSLKERFSDRLRLILISEDDSLESKLDAVRTAANHHLKLPINRIGLIDIFKNTANIRDTNLSGITINQSSAVNNYIEFLFSFTDSKINKINDDSLVGEAIAKYRPTFVILSNTHPTISASEFATLLRYESNSASVCIHELSNSSALHSTTRLTNKNINQIVYGPIRPDLFVQKIIAKTTEFYASITRKTNFETELLGALNQHAIVSITDRAGNIDYANDQFCRTSQYNRNELIGKNHRILNSGQHSKEFFLELWQTISSGQTWSGVIQNHSKDGSPYWVDSTIHPVLNEHGIAYRYISIRTEITDSIFLKRQLEEQRNELELIFDSAPSMLYFFDRNGKLLRVNKAVQRGLNIPVEQIVGLPIESFFNTTDAGKIVSRYRKAIKTGKAAYGVIESIEVQDIRYWISADLIPFRNPRNEVAGVIAFANDITTLVNSQKNLELSEQRLRTSQNFGNIGTWDFDITNSKVHVSDTFSEMFGIQEDYKAQHEDLAQILLEMIHPEDTKHYLKVMGDAVTGKYPDGFSFDHRVIMADGTIKWLTSTGNSIRDETGTNIHLMGVTRDITAEVHLAEQRDEYEKQLIETRDEAEAANQAKSVFLSNMSHELRTPLNAILGFSQLLLMDIDPNHDPELPCYSQEIFNAGQHLLDLINDILDLARIESGKQEVILKQIDLSTTLHEALGLVEPLIAEQFLTLNLFLNGAAISTRQKTIELPLLADARQLKQCLLNLLSNAIKYNQAGGQIDIHIDTTDGSKTYISITDTGAGLSLEQQSDLFKPFTRLSNKSEQIEGTGIGLVITKRIIEQMGGNLGVTSTVGQGSTFWIKLPNHKDDTANLRTNSQDSSTTENISEGMINIIYIDDNRDSSNLIINLLKSRPLHQLITTDDPSTCVSMAAAHQAKLILINPDLLEKNHCDLLAALHNDTKTNQIPIVFIGQAATPSNGESAVVHSIGKPINTLELLQCIDQFTGPGTNA